MTEQELVFLEKDFEDKGPLTVGQVRRLFAEIRASWAAIHDLRQESSTYRRAIVDAVKVMTNMPAFNETSEAIADLALTKEEYGQVLKDEPTPLCRVYDVQKGDHKYGGKFFDLNTGEEFSEHITRWCPDGGWYETYARRSDGTLEPKSIHRVWRRFRYEPNERPVTTKRELENSLLRTAGLHEHVEAEFCPACNGEGGHGGHSGSDGHWDICTACDGTGERRRS